MSPQDLADRLEKASDNAKFSIEERIRRGAELGALVRENMPAILAALRSASEIDSKVRNEDTQVALWMMSHGYATGHGETIVDMLVELESQARQARPAIVVTNC